MKLVREPGKRDSIKMMHQDQKGTSNSKGSGRSALPFLIEFVKFSTGFAALVAIGLFSLHIANAAL